MPEDDEPEVMLELSPDTDVVRPTAGESVQSGSGGAAAHPTVAGSGAAGYADSGAPAYVSGGEVGAIGQGATGEVGITGRVDPKPDEEDE